MNEEWMKKVKEAGMDLCPKHPRYCGITCRYCTLLKDRLSGVQNHQSNNLNKKGDVDKILSDNPVEKINVLLLENTHQTSFYITHLGKENEPDQIISLLTQCHGEFKAWKNFKIGEVTTFCCCLIRLLELKISLESIFGYYQSHENPSVLLALLIYARIATEPLRLDLVYAFLKNNPKRIIIRGQETRALEFFYSLIDKAGFEDWAFPSMDIVARRKFIMYKLKTED